MQTKDTDLFSDDAETLDDSLLADGYSENWEDELKRILAMLLNQTGHDFSLYKRNTIYRRIERRMGIHKIARISEYTAYLRQNPHEIDMLFDEMLIGVTNFFREPESFELLKQNVIPGLLEKRRKERTLRIWIPGCSTGEEAYSVAIVIMECLEELMLVNSFKVHIFATDINNRAIENARQGIYPENISADVSAERLNRYFIRSDDDSYQVRKNIREMVVFAPQNLIMDPPFIKLDMLCCRNLLIYFSSELQKRLMPVFHYSLNPGGILFLGSSESIGSFTNYFSSIDSKLKIYERKQISSITLPFTDYTAAPALRENRMKESGKKDDNLSIPEQLQQILMEDYTPPAVVINDNGDILYISGRTGRYLEPSPGKANLNIFAMARDEIRLELGKAIREAIIKNECITVNLLNVKYHDAMRNICITVSPFNKRDIRPVLYIIIFQDTIGIPESDTTSAGLYIAGEQAAAVMELEGQLEYTRGHLQSVIEEMESSQEELKSMNEELQSTNEELQSTNEELKTSREEMQSLNEELFTMNTELQAKNEELLHSNNDMKNLISNVKIATVFLDSKLNIKSFTPEMPNIINLIPTDVGRPISDIVHKLKDFNLVMNATEVLDTLVYKELEVQHTNGCWYNVRIRPYRTMDNVIDGVVITFCEITMNKQLAESAAIKDKLLKCIMASINEPVLVLDNQLNILFSNTSFKRRFRLNPDDIENMNLFELNNGKLNIPDLKGQLEEVLNGNANIRSLYLDYEFEAEDSKGLYADICCITGEGTEKRLVLLTIKDMTC